MTNAKPNDRQQFAAVVYGVEAAAMSKVLFEANKAGVGLLHISDNPNASQNMQVRVNSHNVNILVNSDGD